MSILKLFLILVFLLFVIGCNPLCAQFDQDSLRKRMVVPIERVDSATKLTHRIAILADSLNPNLSSYNRKLEFIKGNLRHRIDSLTRLNLPASHYAILLDSITKAGPPNDLKQAEAKLASLQSKLNAPLTKLNAVVNKVQTKINQKLNSFTQEAGPGANLPGNVNLPTGQAGLPNIPQQGLTTTLPNANLNLPSTLPGASNPLGQINALSDVKLPGGTNELGKVRREIKDVMAAPKDELGKLKSSGELGQVSKQLGNATEITNQVKGYSTDIQKISDGKFDSLALSKTLENKASQMVGMNDLQSKSQLNQLKTMTAKAYDEKAVQDLALQEGKKQAIDHFAGKEKELKAAMDRLTKYKKKYASLSNIKDIPKHAQNEMHGKPVIERIVPGINLQIQKKHNVLLDWNLFVGYRFNQRLTVGAGWNERVGIHHYYHFTLLARIYGPRTFAEFKYKKGFALRAEVEAMNAFVPSLATGINDPGSRQWVLGVFGGIKKEFGISRHLTGNIQMLYNFTDKVYKTSPYGDRFNVRMGFEFPMKKKKSR